MKRLLLQCTRGVLTALALLCLANAQDEVSMYALWLPQQSSSTWQRADSGDNQNPVFVMIAVSP